MDLRWKVGAISYFVQMENTGFMYVWQNRKISVSLTYQPLNNYDMRNISHEPAYDAALKAVQ